MKKISFIGCGNIGSTSAMLFGTNGDYEIILKDVNISFCVGKSLDLSHAIANSKTKSTVHSASTYKDISDSDVIIVTAGKTRSGDMTREDLVHINANIIKDIAKNVSKYSPKAFVIIVTNPLDTMVNVFKKNSSMLSNMIVGMSGALDSARFAYFLSKAFNVNLLDIEAYIFGGHGDSMIPICSQTKINNIPLNDYCSSNKAKKSLSIAVDKTRNAGRDIINFVGTSSFFAPASCIYSMALSYLNNKSEKFCCCTEVPKNEYGSHESIYVGCYSSISSKGVKFEHLDITEEERLDFLKSINSVIEVNKKT